MMKKIIAILTVIVMCVGFCSCDKSEEITNSESELLTEENTDKETYWELYKGEAGINVDIYDDSDILSDEKEEEIRKALKEKYSDSKPKKQSDDSITNLFPTPIKTEHHKLGLGDNVSEWDSYETLRSGGLDSIFELDGHTVETEVTVDADSSSIFYEIYATYDDEISVNVYMEFNSVDYDLTSHCIIYEAVNEEDVKFIIEDNKIWEVFSDEEEPMLKNLENKYSDSKVAITEDSVKGLIKEDIPLIKGLDNNYYSNGKVRAEELDSLFKVNDNKIETYLTISIEKNIMLCKIYAYYGDDNNGKDEDDKKYFYSEINFKKTDTESNDSETE